jgi:hypothetical protein
MSASASDWQDADDDDPIAMAESSTAPTPYPSSPAPSPSIASSTGVPSARVRVLRGQTKLTLDTTAKPSKKPRAVTKKRSHLDIGDDVRSSSKRTKKASEPDQEDDEDSSSEDDIEVLDEMSSLDKSVCSFYFAD